jgi:luciferase family oxidoreductase group 1
MPHMALPPLSVLDLSPIVQGGDAARALAGTLSLAQAAEALGYRRYWLAEHHNFPGIASAATSVVICHVASGTRNIRVGAGGVMLPNHSPLVIAEQYGTLEALFPGRIDLGLGRAPGTDRRTAHALRRELQSSSDSFPDDVKELQGYFEDPVPGQAVRAIPGAGMKVPIWILGSSLFGARLAASLGLPFAFASHFAPELMMFALELYRREFQPSARWERPYVMLGLNVVAAGSDEEARYIFSSAHQALVELRRGEPGQLPPPMEGYEASLTPSDAFTLSTTLRCTVVGSKETVARGVKEFAERTGADELMVVSQIFDQRARLRSYELLAQGYRGP